MKTSLMLVLACLIVFTDMWIVSTLGEMASAKSDIQVAISAILAPIAIIANFFLFKYIYQQITKS